MSEYTKCCYCALQNIKRRAKKLNKKIVLKIEMGGTVVYVEGEKVAWLMGLTKQCAC